MLNRTFNHTYTTHYSQMTANLRRFLFFGRADRTLNLTLSLGEVLHLLETTQLLDLSHKLALGLAFLH